MIIQVFQVTDREIFCSTACLGEQQKSSISEPGFTLRHNVVKSKPPQLEETIFFFLTFVQGMAIIRSRICIKQVITVWFTNKLMKCGTH